MTGYCKYCGSLVDESEITMLTSMSKQGDAWIENRWYGCNDCADRRLEGNATVKK